MRSRSMSSRRARTFSDSAAPQALTRYWEEERSAARASYDAAREGFEIGSRQSWEQLLNHPVALQAEPPSQTLKAATADTYLAINALGATSTVDAP